MFQIENCSYVGVQDLNENSNQPMHNLEFATMVYFMVLLLQICLTVTLISLIIKHVQKAPIKIYCLF